jgi:hypothetical protein
MLAVVWTTGYAQQPLPTVAQVQATQARLICMIKKTSELDDGVTDVEVMAKKVLAACNAERLAEARVYAAPGQTTDAPVSALDQMNAEGVVRNARQRRFEPTVIIPQEKSPGTDRRF